MMAAPVVDEPHYVTRSSSPSASPLVKMQSVTFQYPGATAPSLLECSLRLHAGDRVLLIGHNGSGKSTLLALLAGQRRPRSGCVRVLQRDPFDDTTMHGDITLIAAPWPAQAIFANTVERLTSPTPHVARRARIAKALNVSLSAYVHHMSAGERRRVQLLHGLLQPAQVYLLDECSTDVDVAERQTLLRIVQEQCAARGGCCVYATHIFDRLANWATHLLFLDKGRVGAFVDVRTLQLPVERYVLRYLQKTLLHRPFARVGTAASGARDGQEDDACNSSLLSQAALSPLPLPDSLVYGGDDEQPACIVRCTALTYKDVFVNLSFDIYRGERVLLCGCNGVGKSVLLNMLGGKQFFNNAAGQLRVLGKVCYDDMTLNAQIAYAGDWWESVPGGEVHVREMLALDAPRARFLAELLEVRPEWDVRHLSAGEQKRVQLLLHLAQDKPLVLLDEATTDLDVDQRYRLLHFLFAESTQRGVTVVYATHIFGGLDGWATTALLLDRTTRGLHAVWREPDTTVDLERLTDALIALKAQERRV